MDVGKGREQERKLFRHPDCRKHQPLLSPGRLIPAYFCVHHIHLLPFHPIQQIRIQGMETAENLQHQTQANAHFSRRQG